jgi:signal transduction histidine kinase
VTGPLRLSVKLGLVLFGLVAGALALVYLAVVPMLESRLVDGKVRELERASVSVVRPVQQFTPVDYARIANGAEEVVGARVVIFERIDDRTLIALADSRAGGQRSRELERDPIALEAAETGEPAWGRISRGGEAFAEAARPAGESRVVLLSAPLRDALGTVGNVQRAVLIAGAFALVVSWLAGYILARRFVSRIQRLEDAAGQIAAGNFDVPVTVGGDDEVGQLGRAFDAMRLRLAHLDHARREFIANASHELRTPLFALGGFLELLSDEDVDERERREFVVEMAAQVERLTRLATDLLDLSRLDAGQLAVERVDLDLAETARTVVEEFRAVAEGGGHELRVVAADGVHALGDEQRVLQIARILVENSLKHTPAGTAVEVAATRLDGRAALSVRDDGPGIPATAQEHLFERFYRADGGKASGSGLGLAIAHELAVRMDGAIELRSRRGETVFTLFLPTSSAPAVAFPRQNDLEQESHPPRLRESPRA